MINERFGVACNMTGAYIIIEAIAYITKWISELNGIPGWFMLILLIVRTIPTACLLMVLIFILRGAADVYIEMEMKTKRMNCLRTEVYTIAAFASQLMLNVVLGLEDGTKSLSLFLRIFIVIVYIFNVVVMVVLYIRVKQFSYDYYLYSYNNRL